MKERLITLLFALGALALFIAMFARGEGGLDPRKDVPRPTTAERRGNGYYAAMSWLDAENVRTLSLRDRFNTLPGREDLPPSGNLLIVTLPATVSFRTEEFVPLDRWVRAGNTLLVLAALADNPDWAFRFAGLTPGDLNLLTGLEFETTRSRERRLQQMRGARRAQDPPDSDEALATHAQPQRTALVPNRNHVYFSNVREAVALSDYTRQTWAVKVPYEGFALVLAHESGTQQGAVWTRPLGEGRIIVSGFGSLFTNRALGLADNARLLANIVAATIGPRGAVLFDDAHQGLGAAYDPQMFYGDRRLHNTLGILLALWLVWVLGSTRLRVPVTQAPAPREGELVRATGGFMARVLGSAEAARRLFEHFFRGLSTRSAERQHDGDAWSGLERHPRVAAADIAQLRDWYTAAYAGRRIPLRKLHNLMVRIHGQIS